ncbi:hypothetical protein GCM10010260_82330 [Streptomyces filipinensis]|uniref:Uncharacterized protein n=1 Tax=Streptomyces filipinensis TaxID=66887 RepID=A0A918IJX5_9ACTN|nr:hypothetical protein GCM10010260_82330 [Streptomyces filipinensis]
MTGQLIEEPRPGADRPVLASAGAPGKGEQPWSLPLSRTARTVVIRPVRRCRWAQPEEAPRPAPAADAYMDSGRDETGLVDLAEVLGARPARRAVGGAPVPAGREDAHRIPEHAKETVRDVRDIAVHW